MMRLLAWAVFWSAVAIGLAAWGGLELPREQEEGIARELQEKVTPAAIEARIAGALDRGDVEDARMYLALAEDLGRPVSPALRQRLAAADELSAAAQRGAKEFGAAFLTGEATSPSGLAGAVLSDLTVVGDVRDIVTEGGRMIVGQPYDEIMLGLSAVGLAATGATVATAGGGLPAKVGISVFKVAKRVGTLTADLGRALGRALREAVDFDGLGRALRSTAMLDGASARAAVSTAVRRAGAGDLARMLGHTRRLSDTVGPGETVRLLKYARSTQDLDDLAALSARFGRGTRGIVEITGKTSLRAFKTGVRVLSAVLENIWAVLAWFGGLIALMVGRLGMRLGWRALRGRPSHAM